MTLRVRLLQSLRSFAMTNKRVTDTYETVSKPFDPDVLKMKIAIYSSYHQKDAFTVALITGKSSHNEIITIQCFDGTFKTILSSASPLRGLDDKIVGAVAVIQDITEHKKIEEHMEESIMKLVSIGVDLEQRGAIS